MVLTSGCFPDVWNQGNISPIHKSGDKSDPNNYSGVYVNSNLGKVFSSILNSRIQTFLQEKNLISKCQIGFLPNHRTSDHIQLKLEVYIHNYRFGKSVRTSVCMTQVIFPTIVYRPKQWYTNINTMRPRSRRNTQKGEAFCLLETLVRKSAY